MAWAKFMVEREAPSFRLQNYLAHNVSVKFILEECITSGIVSYVFENKLSVTRGTLFWETLLRIDLRSYDLFLNKLIVVAFV
jgi:hypothetical protein